MAAAPLTFPYAQSLFMTAHMRLGAVMWLRHRYLCAVLLTRAMCGVKHAPEETFYLIADLRHEHLQIWSGRPWCFHQNSPPCSGDPYLLLLVRDVIATMYALPGTISTLPYALELKVSLDNHIIIFMNRGEKQRSCQVPWCGLHPAVADYCLEWDQFCIAFLRSSELATLVMCTITDSCNVFSCSSRTTDTLRTGGQLPMSTLTRWHASLSRPPSPSEQHSAGSAAAASHP